MPLAYWVHDLSPFLIRFSENFGIRYYGLAYLAGFAVAAWFLYLAHRAGRSRFGMESIADLMTYIVVGVLVGGRLGYFLLYKFEDLLASPLVLIRVWEGGMASHGGFIGVCLAVWWWTVKRKAPLLQVADLIATVTPAGFLFGRIANFINGELVGKVTSVPWAVIFPHNELDAHLTQAPPRHPSQLYAATLEGALLLVYMQWRFWRSNASRDQPGRLWGEYLMLYAIVRMISERFREPDASLLFGLSRGTFYSVFLIIGGAVLIARAPKATRA